MKVKIYHINCPFNSEQPLAMLPQLERMQPPVEGLPTISRSGAGYNELLYAHLLDGEVDLLT